MGATARKETIVCDSRRGPGINSRSAPIWHSRARALSLMRRRACALTRDNVQLLQPAPEGVGSMFRTEVTTGWSLPRQGLPSQVDAGGPRLGERSSGAPCRMRHPSPAARAIRNKARWEARSETMRGEISRLSLRRRHPDLATWFSACRTRRGGATRRPSRCAPWGRGRATGTCPETSSPRAYVE
jgi:hypothetical protein